MRYLISCESRRLRSTTKSTVRFGERSIRSRKALQPRSGWLGRAVDDEIGPQVLAIFERPDFRAFLDEEVERIVDRHVGDDVDLDPQFVDQLREDVARQPVAVRILLKVHEMIGGRHFQRMRDHARAAVRSGPQADDLRARATPAGRICNASDDGSRLGSTWGLRRSRWRIGGAFHRLLRRTIHHVEPRRSQRTRAGPPRPMMEPSSRGTSA